MHKARKTRRRVRHVRCEGTQVTKAHKAQRRVRYMMHKDSKTRKAHNLANLVTASLLKVTLFHGYFSRFVKCTKGTKS